MAGRRTATPGLALVRVRTRWRLIHLDSGLSLPVAFDSADEALIFAEGAGELARWDVNAAELQARHGHALDDVLELAATCGGVADESGRLD